MKKIAKRFVAVAVTISMLAGGGSLVSQKSTKVQANTSAVSESSASRNSSDYTAEPLQLYHFFV